MLGPVHTVRSGVGDGNRFDASSNETIREVLDSLWSIRSEFNEPGQARRRVAVRCHRSQVATRIGDEVRPPEGNATMRGFGESLA